MAACAEKGGASKKRQRGGLIRSIIPAAAREINTRGRQQSLAAEMAYCLAGGLARRAGTP
jgi:hypothetical protein